MLKKKYLRYRFETENEELSNNVIEICDKLKRGIIVVEVFLNDSLNDTLLLNSTFLSKNGNFNYYICKQTNFFKSINFFDVRHICIYSIEKLPEQINRKYLNNNSSFCICFENYFDTCHLEVYPKYYSNSIETYLNQKKYIIKKRFG